MMRTMLVTVLIYFAVVAVGQSTRSSNWIVKETSTGYQWVWTYGFNCPNLVEVDSIRGYFGTPIDIEKKCDSSLTHSMFGARHTVLTMIDYQLITLKGLQERNASTETEEQIEDLTNQRILFENPDSYKVNTGEPCFDFFKPSDRSDIRRMSVRTAAGVWGWADCVRRATRRSPADD